MEKVYLFLLIIVLLFNNIFTSNERESFIEFLYEFSVDKNFQVERVKFPLEKIELSQKLDKKVSIKIKKDDWKFIKLLGGNQVYITDIKDSFRTIEIDSNERVFCLIGIENGIDIKYYFKRFDGLWYLIKIEDYSS